MTMSEKQNIIGQDFSTFGLLKFAAPSFFMNIFTQIFRTLDDALFVSRYVGETALAGINILMPVFSIQMGMGHLFSAGAANVSARLMGEKKQEEAMQVFTKIVVSALVIGTFFSVMVNIFAKPILLWLKADDSMSYYAMYQLRYVYGVAPFTLLNSIFSAYFSTAGKPKMGMICSIANGVTNIVLDLVLVAYLRIGLLGVCIATVVGELIVFLIGFVFFCNKKNEIHFVVPKGRYIPVVIDSAKYSFSQFINSCTIGVANLITNNLLLAMIGSDGVAANAIIADVRAIITSGLFGIILSISPVIAFNYGSKNVERLRRILYSLLKIWFVGSLALVGVGLIIRTPLVKIFMSESSSEQFYQLALFGLTIEMFSVPFTSGAVAVTRTFVALHNVKAATVLSVFRNLVSKVTMLWILPVLYGVTGIWLAFPAGEAGALLLGIIFLYINRDNYGYGPKKIAYKMMD